MGDLISLAAHRRKKEIENAVCSTGPDPIDEALNKEFVERQIAQMQQSRGALHDVLDRLQKLADDLKGVAHGSQT